MTRRGQVETSLADLGVRSGTTRLLMPFVADKTPADAHTRLMSLSLEDRRACIAATVVVQLVSVRGGKKIERKVLVSSK
ncbi:MAG: hypothetical protein H0T54_07500 [Geodermatophilaceae bacterium]|nr:hypothetical protein [Geodermatophilaceae bacterium]